jgi:hypothetical protein
MKRDLTINYESVYSYSAMFSFTGTDPGLHGICACRGPAWQ